MSPDDADREWSPIIPTSGKLITGAEWVGNTWWIRVEFSPTCCGVPFTVKMTAGAPHSEVRRRMIRALRRHWQEVHGDRRSWWAWRKWARQNIP